ncbi:MAG: hypothetical protein ABH832_00340 [bacterium]
MKRKIAPHLPSPSCNLKNHTLFLRMKNIFFVILICAMVSVPVSIIVVSWVLPSISDSSIWINQFNRSDPINIQLSDIEKKDLKTKTTLIYDQQKIGRKNSSTTSNIFLGRAINISYDGWTALYYPEYKADESNLLGVSHDNRTYMSERRIFDRHTGILYLKLNLKGDNLRVANLGAEITPTDDYYALTQNSYDHINISGPYFIDFGEQIDAAPRVRHSLSGSYTAKTGSFIVDRSGKVVGLIEDSGHILPMKYINGFVQDLLSNNSLQYVTLGVSGWFSAQRPIIIDDKSVQGFHVTKLNSNKNALKSDDIILLINGTIVDEDNLWYNTRGKKTAELVVLRGGNRITILADVLPDLQ